MIIRNRVTAASQAATAIYNSRMVGKPRKQANVNKANPEPISLDRDSRAALRKIQWYPTFCF